MAAPVAMGMDPTLSSALIAIARRNGWAEPVAETRCMEAELADNEKAGGNVHMQPLISVAQSLDGTFSGLWFAASSTGKTVASGYGLQLHIAAGNVLCALLNQSMYYLHIRSFESDKVSTHAFAAGHPVTVKVQHGDVIAMCLPGVAHRFSRSKQLHRPIGKGVALKRQVILLFSKGHTASFLAIVESDRLEADGRQNSRKRKGGSKRATKERGNQQKRRKLKQGRAGNTNASHDGLQES